MLIIRSKEWKAARRINVSFSQALRSEREIRGDGFVKAQNAKHLGSLPQLSTFSIDKERVFSGERPDT